MPVAQIQHTVPELLVRVGATLRPKGRADCPQCRRKRSLSHNEEVFFCHGCNWKGNTFTLARDLGLTKPVSKKEGRALRESRDKAQRAAGWATGRIRVRRQELYQFHRDLLDIYHGSVTRLNRNRQDEIGWSCLAYFYNQIPAVRAELTLLEDAPPLERLAFLDSNDAARAQAIDDVILAGSLPCPDGKFVEVQAN